MSGSTPLRPTAAAPSEGASARCAELSALLAGVVSYGEVLADLLAEHAERLRRAPVIDATVIELESPPHPAAAPPSGQR